MLDDVTQQYWSSVFFVSMQLAHVVMSHNIGAVFCAWSVPRTYLEDIRRYNRVESSGEENSEGS
jgi:hypothetical protein